MIGTWIRDRRKTLDLTQAELAKKVGTSQVQVSCWETNKFAPHSLYLTRLIEVLGPAPELPSATRQAPAVSRSRTPIHLAVGDFATINAEPSVAKVLVIEGETATVGFFRSLGQRSSARQVSLSALKPARLHPQTRCFLKEADEKWCIGRIGRYVGNGEYEVLLPDRQARFVTAANLYVRSASPVEDPLEVLLHGGQESPYLHDRRHACRRFLIQQRAVAHGMTGLLSSRIDLYPHQVEVVRRVLEDPIQRYLLADEVGLGKTIEAGVILRQYLLDQTAPRAVVVVPPLLVEQWRRELAQKFCAFTDSEAVSVCGSNEVEVLDAITSCGLLIVDEAHHVAALAFADDSLSRARFETFARLARLSKRVLLLSATPVLRHERDFLAMLHLLDPERYRLADETSFRRRVEKRQTVGRTLRALREDLANPTLIKLNLGTLRREFQEDAHLAQLASRVEEVLVDGRPPESLRSAIRSLRIHISETYRLHRRMVRTRRRSVEDRHGTVLAPRIDETNKNAAGLIAEYDIDESAELVHDLLDTWRSSAAASLPMVAAGDVDEWSGQREALRQIFITLFETGGTWLPILGRTVRCRLNQTPDAVLRNEIGDVALKALCNTPHFSGEPKILSDLLELLESPPPADRIGLLIEVAQNISRATPPGVKPLKVAVFSSYTLVCQELTARMAAVFGPESLACHQLGRNATDVERDVARFKDPNSECRYLIVDRSGEEGRNFQSADIMVHFDLPWSPNRLEQRIGRLDRIGRERAIRARVFLGPDCEGSIYDSWFRLLRDGLGVFNSSIAALQFFIDERLPLLAADFFAGGADALDGAIEALRIEVAEEHVRLGDQDAVDEVDALVGDGREYAQSLAEFDGQYETADAAIHGWVSGALRFSSFRDSSASTIQYTPSKYSLVPAEVILERFHQFLGGYSATYDREVCTMLGDVALLRAGDPFVDAIAEYMQWDDRGQAFALWRQVRSWPAAVGAEWVGFRFNYVVEADVEAARGLAAELMPQADLAALRRRADAWFPPFVRTVFTGADGVEVNDVNLIKIVEAPYVKVEDGGRDTNIAKDKAALIWTCIDRDRWPSLCTETRDAARSILLGSKALRTACSQNAAKAESELFARIDQLRLRLADEREGRSPDSEEHAELEAERRVGAALIEGIRHPRVSLDSVGLIIISGRDPLVPQSKVGQS